MQNLAAVLAHQGPDNDKDNAKLSEAAELQQRALRLSQQPMESTNPAHNGGTGQYPAQTREV